MQTKNLCVLNHIWTKGEVGAPLNRFKPSSKILYWPFQGGTSFVELLCFSGLCMLYAFVRVCLLCACWERSVLLALVCGVLLWVCYFPNGILGQVRYMVVTIPDLCTLTYSDMISHVGPESEFLGCTSWHYICMSFYPDLKQRITCQVKWI